MKSKSTLTWCLLLLAFSVHATPVSLQEASRVAATFLKQSVTDVAVPFEHLYVFNGDHSFVIVADDDVVTPIIGYSHERCFDAASINDNLRGWLTGINENIQAAMDKGTQASDQVREQWDSLRSGRGLPAVNRTVVEPMVMTQWDQNNPYNLYCPGGCPTGCAATAMAQVMKYWEFPNHGIGSHSYNHPEYGALAANFGTATYEWDHMPMRVGESSPEVEKQAVATLMYHCGVSMEMDYGPDASAGQMTELVSILPNYFGYAPTVEWMFQRNYSDDAWKSLLKAELNASRPMCYAANLPRKGASIESFHAFVCDGYDALDYFHFNWGWGGSGDGYYTVNSMIPTGETNYNYVVKGISPIFTVTAPNDLTATLAQGQVLLAWTMPQGAVSCNVYRDDELIATGVTTGTYCDVTMSYGTHAYYLKAIASNGNRSWKSNTVEVLFEFTAPVPTSLAATVADDSLTLYWDMPSLMHDTLAYGTGPYLESYGFGPLNPKSTFWGQRYPAEMLRPYGGYDIKGVSLYVTQSGPYTLNVCRGNNEGVTEVMAQQTFDLEGVGWRDMRLDTPYPLEFTRDVWVVMNTPDDMYWVMAVCEYNGPGLDDAAFYATGMSSVFYEHGMGHSWMMKVLLDDGLTYRVTRNDVPVASGWHGRTYVDHNLAPGDWNYKVWSSYQGVECATPVSYSVSLARVETAVLDSETGTTMGNGLFEIGSMAAVTAQPNEDYVFVGWLENGVQVSTDNPYRFVVETSRNLVAVFERKYFTINASASLGGTITPDGIITVEREEDAAFTITPDVGCTVLQVLVDGNDVGSVQSYTFHRVTDDHTIQVQFKGYGVDEHAAEVRIAPNPTKDVVRVESTINILSVQLLGINGVLLEERKSNSCKVELNLKGYPKGMYLLRVVTDEGTEIRKINLSE